MDGQQRVDGFHFHYDAVGDKKIQSVTAVQSSSLFDHAADRNEDKRQRSARVSRLLRMLRAHHLIQKVPHTHRYLLTSRGRDIVSAVVASQQITLEQLNKLAA